MDQHTEELQQKAAREFVEKVRKSGRKVSNEQAAEIGKVLALNFEVPQAQIFPLLNAALFAGVDRSIIDSKVQNERNRLRSSLGLTANGPPAVFTLAQVQEAWKSAPEAVANPAAAVLKDELGAPKHSPEYKMFLERVSLAGGPDKAAQLEKAKKGGFAKTKPNSDVDSPAVPPVPSATSTDTMSLAPATQSLPSEHDLFEATAQHERAEKAKQDAALAQYQQFLAFQAHQQALTASQTSAPTSPVKGNSRDASPVALRPQKIVKIGESDFDADVSTLQSYDPVSVSDFDLKTYGNVISSISGGHVLLVDSSTHEITVTIASSWWTSLEVTFDKNTLRPAVRVNVVPDDEGQFQVLSQVYPDFVTKNVWRMKATRQNICVPQAAFSCSLPIPKRIINLREAKIECRDVDKTFRIVSVKLPFLQTE